MEGSILSNVNDITRDAWILSTFPEWGTWLNEEIDAEFVEENALKMWWLGCTGIWLKTAHTDITVDVWFGTGKRTKAKKYIDPHHQMARMCGGRNLQPNLRACPVVYDPFAVKKVDAVLATHAHSDHMDINFAAAVLKNCGSEVKFIGPKRCADIWTSWGVPADRIVVMAPGRRVTVGDVDILALESFDRTALITAEADVVLKDKQPPDMNELAVNYLLQTPGGNVYHSGDSHYSNMYAKHGNEHKIDIALGSYGENPRGITDKMTSSDILRMAEALRTRVIIPFHHDVWTNFQADPNEILLLYNYRKHMMNYEFKPFIWSVGGKFTYPAEADTLQYHYPRGFDDCFSVDTDLPFPAFL